MSLSTPERTSRKSSTPSSSPDTALQVSILHRGHLIHISGSPNIRDAAAHLMSIEDGVLAVNDAGVIVYSGCYQDLPLIAGSPQVLDHRPAFLIPGFVDTHIHFPQTFAVDSYGGGELLEWLDNCIFPAETRLQDEQCAHTVAAAFCRRRIAVGTTTAMVFGSPFPAAQDALFEESVRTGLRTVSGRGIQTVGPPSARGLITTEKAALELTSAEIDRWHGDQLTQVAVVPRFALSVTPRTLAALGELYEEVRGRGVYFHSHLSENNRPGTGEIAMTLATFGVEQYLDTYDGRFLPGSAVGGRSLLGRRSILAHAVHCTDRELARLAETSTSISHCPTSQQFLGSGTMPWRRTVEHGVTISLGSDIGAGDEWLMSRVANDCFKVHQSEPGTASVSIHPAELLFAATLAGARALDMEKLIGNLDAGKDADFLVIDPRRHPPLDERLRHGHNADEPETATAQILFALMMGLRESAITEVYVKGRNLNDQLG